MTCGGHETLSQKDLVKPLKHCCSVSGARLTLVQQMPNIAWVSFDLQEHKIHNNVALVMGHYYTQLYRSAAIVHEDCSQNYTTHTHACTFYIVHVHCIVYRHTLIHTDTDTHSVSNTYAYRHSLEVQVWHTFMFISYPFR